MNTQTLDRTLTCPVCRGTCRQAVDATGKPLDQLSEHPRWSQYAKRGWMECRNCGGQGMSLQATGRTYARRDTGEPCRHEFVGRNAGRCYTEYRCKHCPEAYAIDSSD